MKLLSSLVVIICISIPSIGQNQYSYTQPNELSDGWKTNDLNLLKFDTVRIHELFSQLYSKEHKIHSVLIVKNNEILIEEYFGSNGQHTPHDLRSVTKSIRSILTGIAIEEGFITSIDDPITKYIKRPIAEKNLDPRKEKITIRHLLTMSTGLECNDWAPKSKGQEDRVYKKKDWAQYTLNLPMINEPGTVSNYCSMGTLLLAEVISQASDMTIDTFAQRYLFDPLGITNVDWAHTSNKEVIASAKRTYLTSRDMAKIGQLILNEGDWNGKQIVSKQWVDMATTPKTKITDMDYGFLWWTIPFKINELRFDAITATGNGGQYILIFPELDMVAVFTGGAYNSQEDKLPFSLINQVFIPTFMSRNPISE